MSRRSIFISLSLALFIAGCILAFRTATPEQEKLSVIVLTVESLRKDMVNAETTPQLLEFARQGFSFSSHRAISAWTGTNIISLLTGLSPFEAGVHTRSFSLPAEQTVPLEILQENGYLVEGIQGFMAMDIYRNLGISVTPQFDNPRYWLAERKSRNEPFFLWYHYVHTHLPYSSVHGYSTEATKQLDQQQLPPDQQQRLELVREKSAIHYEQAIYTAKDIELIHQLQQSTIAEFDDWFAEFREFFFNSGLNRNTILVITADHGDEHGERGMVGHGSTTQLAHLHEEIVRTPLIVWLPEKLADKYRDTDTSLDSTHIDILPTVFNLMGVETDLPLQGRHLFNDQIASLWKAMTSSGGFAEADPEAIRYFEYGLVQNSYKLLLRIDREGKKASSLYDLKTDPEEKYDISSQFPKITADMQNQLIPDITARTILKPLAPERTTPKATTAPKWVLPTRSGIYSYDDLQNTFKLEWTGNKDATYLVEYIAGTGATRLKGSLEVTGIEKDFGNISRRYWQTWVVDHSPIRLRVKEATGDNWSQWLQLEAKP